MGNVTYGSKLYSDLKSSLPDDVFKKKYGHLKAKERAVVQQPKAPVKKSGLGSDSLADAIKHRQGMSKMFGGGLDLKEVGKRL